MTAQRKYFGTDGIRGKVGQPPITADFILRLGYAVGSVFKDKKRGKALIGKDTRISGYMFESALEAGLSAAGMDICLLGPMPTPAIAYLTRTFHAQVGIVISASHNPYYDNGIKFFSREGTKLADDIELKIEAALNQTMGTVESAQLGKASRIEDAPGRYIEFCKSTVPMSFGLSGLKIVVDCANGATYQVAPNVFRELGAQVMTMGTEPNGLNINDHCGALHTEGLQKRVIEEQADLGIALDGDGDRIMMVDHKGKLLDGDEILYILAHHRLQQGELQGGVVGTLMSNLGLELALKDRGIPFVRTKVGDRYVIEELIRQNWLIGGETSGHILCRDMTTTGDGIICALQVLKVMLCSQKSLHELSAGLTKFPQIIRNVVVTDKSSVGQHEDVVKAVKSAEKFLKGRGRVLLRPSGTEPVVRVMVEGEDASLINKVAQDIVNVVDNAQS